MATYKKLLKNRAGDTIIPVVGQIQFDVVPFTGTRCSGNVIRSGNFGFTFGTTEATLRFPLSAENQASKSCKVAFMLPVVFPD